MKTSIAVCAIVVLSILGCAGERFVSFPAGGELPSPDGHFIVRNLERDKSPQAFAGAFHTLVLDDVSTKSRRKLCDYLHHVQVAWSATGNRILVNEYFTGDHSRLLVFRADTDVEPVIIDRKFLTEALPAAQAEHLRNTRSYIEALGITGDQLLFRIRGDGQVDPEGFKFTCEYGLVTEKVSCHLRVQER